MVERISGVIPAGTATDVWAENVVADEYN